MIFFLLLFPLFVAFKISDYYCAEARTAAGKIQTLVETAEEIPIV